MYIFSMDNPFFRFVGRLVDLVWLNILTLICCIPVVTAGAAISAMYHVLIKIVLQEEGVVTRPFFKEFKSNFVSATKVWIPCAAILLIMFSNGYLIHQGVLNIYPNLVIAAGVSIGIISVAVVMFLNYYFALLSRYDSKTMQTVKNAILMLFAYFPRSLCIVIIWFFPIALMTVSDYFLIFWFLYGLSFPGYFNAMILGRLFVKTEKAFED